MTSTAAALLRSVRQRAGLTQVELADRAGMTQSVVSAYEQGRRDPGFDAFHRLVAAAGGDVVVHYRPEGGSSHAPAAHSVRALKVFRLRDRVLEVAAVHGAVQVHLFGSVARGDDGPDSDIDLAVDAPDSVGLVALAGLTRALTSLLDERVDVVPLEAASERVRAAVEREGIRL